MSWFSRLFGKCKENSGFTVSEGEGAPKTSCFCGKVKIHWAYDKPAHRIKCFCNDCQQRVAFMESRAGRKFEGGPIDVNFMWNDIMKFENEGDTQWYRLRKSEWTKHGCLDFCVAECCSSIICGDHPWYKGKFLWTSTVDAKATGIATKPVWAHFFTGDAPAKYVESLKPSNGELYDFTGAEEEVEATKAKLEQLGKAIPTQRGELITKYKWGEKHVLNLELTKNELVCGEVGGAFKPEPAKIKQPEEGGAFSLCCSRPGGVVIQ